MYTYTKFGMDGAYSFVAPNLPKDLNQHLCKVLFLVTKSPRDLNLEGTSSKFGIPAPISNTTYHVEFGKDRTSNKEVLFLVTKSPCDLDLEDTPSKVRIWVPFIKVYTHTKFGMDRADSFVVTNLPEDRNQRWRQRPGEYNSSDYSSNSRAKNLPN